MAKTKETWGVLFILLALIAIALYLMQKKSAVTVNLSYGILPAIPPQGYSAIMQDGTNATARWSCGSWGIPPDGATPGNGMPSNCGFRGYVGPVNTYDKNGNSVGATLSAQ